MPEFAPIESDPKPIDQPIEQPAEQPEEPIETAEIVEPVEIIEPASGEEPSPADIALKQEEARLWDEEFPGFKGQSDVLPADVQARMWMNKAMTVKTVTSPPDEDPGLPEIRPLPIFDPAIHAEKLAKAIEEGDTDERMKLTNELVDYNAGVIQTTNDLGMRNDHIIRGLQSELAEVKLPQTLRTAGRDVPGFQDSDIDMALSLVESGRVSDPALAVFHAVNARLVASKSSAPPSAAEIAAKKAAALKASSTPESVTAATAPEFSGTERFDSPAFKRAMLADAENAARAEK